MLRPLGLLLCFSSVLLFACSQTQPILPPAGINDAEVQKATTDDVSASSAGASLSPSENGFLRQEGEAIVDEAGRSVRFQGIAFGNQVWTAKSVPNAHHDPQVDFQRVADLGFNSVRFYLAERWFFDEEGEALESGFQWLEENLEEAQRAGLYLILNLHVPPGGFQSLGNGDALWEEPSNQDRLVSFWQAIAKRFSDEAAIAGYGLLNEPVPVESLTQWQTLAQRTAEAIREVDQKHLLFVERPLYSKESPSVQGAETFIAIDDDNLAYEFHFYDPFAYTHQLFDWVNLGEAGAYPQVGRSDFSALSWKGWASSVENPRLPPGDSDWSLYESGIYTITDPQIAAIGPVLLSAENGGAAVADELELIEFDEDGSPTGEKLRADFDSDAGWYFWSADGAGSTSLVEGRDGGTALAVSGTSADANANNGALRMPARMGYGYQVRGYLRGEGVTEGAVVHLRMDLYEGQAAEAWDRAFLQKQLQPYFAFGEKMAAPVYLGEFGCGIHCFQEGRGGLNWVSDVLSLVDERGGHFNYHTYHEDAFGLYFGNQSLPDPENVNQPLLEFFEENLR